MTKKIDLCCPECESIEFQRDDVKVKWLVLDVVLRARIEEQVQGNCKEP